MLIDGWLESGKQRLKSATVFVSGAGGMGDDGPVNHPATAVNPQYEMYLPQSTIQAGFPGSGRGAGGDRLYVSDGGPNIPDRSWHEYERKAAHL